MLNSYSARSPQPNKSLNDTRITANILPPEITSTPLNSPNRLRTASSFVTPTKKLLSPRRYALSSNGTMSPMKTIKNPPGPLLTSANYNVNMSTYLDSKSPGLSGRVVQYSEENARNQQHTHQERYGSPGLFPIVHLFKQDIPVISPKPRKATIRIGTPEFKNLYSQEHNRLLLEGIVRNKLIPKEHSINNDVSTRSVLDALKEISRKRIHANEEYELMDETKKKLKRDDEATNGDAETDSSKRNRVDSPVSDTSMSPPTRQATKKLCTIDAILASKTSSMFANTDTGTKRKTIEHPTKISPVNKKKFSNAETQTSNTNQVKKLESVEETPKKEEQQPVKDKKSDIEKEPVVSPPKQVLKVFDDKPLEIIRKNRLGALLSALTGREIPQIPMEDRRKALDQDWPPKDADKKLTSILSTPNKQKTPEKHVTFNLTQEKIEEKETTSDETVEKKEETPSKNEPVKTATSNVVGGFSFDLTKTAVKETEPVKEKPQPNFETAVKKPETTSASSTPSTSISSLPKLSSPSTNLLGLPTSLPSMFQTQNSPSKPSISTVGTSVSSPKPFSTPSATFSLASPVTTVSSSPATVSKPLTFSSGTGSTAIPPPMFSFGKSEAASPAATSTTTSSATLNFGSVVTTTAPVVTSAPPPAFGLNNTTSSNPPGGFSFNSVQSSAPNSVLSPTQSSLISSSTGTSPKSIFSVTTPSFGATSSTSNLKTISSSSTQGGFNFKTPNAPVVSTTAGFSSFAPVSTGAPFGGAKLNFGATTTASTTAAVPPPSFNMGTKPSTTSGSFNLTSSSTTPSFGANTTTSMFGAPTSSSAIATTATSGGTTVGGFKMGNESKPFTFGSSENNTSSLPSSNSSLMFSFKNSQSGMSFGTNTTASSASNVNFAPTSTQFTTSGNGMLSSAFEQQKTQTSNLFGSSANNNVSSFGNNSFGSFTTTASSTTAPAFGGSTFGAPSKTESSLFGGSGFRTSTTVAAFGSATSSGFGATTTSAPGFGTNNAASTFGSTSNTTSSMFGTSNTLSFGTPASTASFATSAPPPAFGASFNAPSFKNTSAVAPFGAAPTTTASSSFNTNGANTSSPFGTSGGASTNPPAFGGFGNNATFSASKQAALSFGATNNFGSSSTFGGSSNAFGAAAPSTQAPSTTPFGNGGGTSTFGNTGSSFNFGGASMRKAAPSNVFPAPSSNNMFGQSETGGFGSTSNNNAATTNAGLFTFGSPNSQAASPSAGVFTFGAAERPKSFNFSAPNAQNPFSGGEGFSNPANVTPFRPTQPSNNNSSMFSIGSGASSTTQNRGRPLVRAKRRI